MLPATLHFVSIAAVMLGVACAGLVAIDVARNPQKMAIMDFVWPVTALFGTLFTVWLYCRWGRRDARKVPPGLDCKSEPTFAVIAAKAAMHCGSGCTLGDMCAETIGTLTPGVLVLLGWHTLFEEKVFAAWALDFIFAFGFGIVFQYFTIVPMRGLGVVAGIRAAVKADTFSLVAWQVGMYGFMAVAIFWLFRDVLHSPLTPDMPEFWFMMQLAMMCGFLTSWPVNAWLIRQGWKEAM